MLRKSLFVFSLILFAVYPIAADPLVITSGRITFTGQGLTRAVFNFSGDGANVFAVADTVMTPNPCQHGCSPGSIASLSFHPFLTPTDFLSGGVMLNGVFYSITPQGYPVPPPSPLVNATFDGPFVAGLTTVPLIEAATIILTTPFTLNGGMTGRSATGMVFNMGLTGSGYATLALSRDQSGGYSFSSLTYEFVPVPEPATIFLLASGIGMLASRLRSRSRL